MEIDPEEDDSTKSSHGGETCTNSSSQSTYLPSLQSHKNMFFLSLCMMGKNDGKGNQKLDQAGLNNRI